MWQVLILIAISFGATSYLLRRVLAQQFPKQHALINATFFGFFLLPTAGILYLFFPGDLNVGWVNFFLLLLGSAIWPLMGVTAFRANKDVDVGIFAIISHISPLITLVIALVFLNETLQPLHFLGIGLVVTSGIIVSTAQLKKHSKAKLKGLIYCFLSAIILGSAIAYEQFMLKRVDFGAYLVYGWGAQIVWSWIMAAKEIKHIKWLFSQSKKATLTILSWGAVGSIRSVAFISALKISGSAAIISAASDFMSVVVVISAYIFLKERDHVLQKGIAAVVGIIGILILT